MELPDFDAPEPEVFPAPIDLFEPEYLSEPEDLSEPDDFSEPEDLSELGVFSELDDSEPDFSPPALPDPLPEARLSVR